MVAHGGRGVTSWWDSLPSIQLLCHLQWCRTVGLDTDSGYQGAFFICFMCGFLFVSEQFFIKCSVPGRNRTPFLMLNHNLALIQNHKQNKSVLEIQF